MTIEGLLMRFALSAAGLLLAVAGFVTFVVIGAGVWAAKKDADRQVECLAAKAQSAGGLAAHAIDLIREIIARARERLAAARAQSVEPDPKANDPLVRFALRKAQRDLPGEVERARDAVGVASEAVLVAGAVLDVFGELPGDGSRYGIRADEVEAARDQLDAASRDLKSARSIFGVPIEGASQEQLRNVDMALDRAQGITDHFEGLLDNTRQKVETTKQEARTWSLRAAAGITALMAVAALGQVFMARACWRGLRGGTA
jgi:hypothetical protein